jgi:hypothetical protein
MMTGQLWPVAPHEAFMQSPMTRRIAPIDSDNSTLQSTSARKFGARWLDATTGSQYPSFGLRVHAVFCDYRL